MQRAALLLAIALLTAGCLGLGSQGTDEPVSPSAPAPAPAGDGSTDARQGFDWSQPHVHDYWNERTSTKLIDAPVKVYMAHNHAFDQPPRELHTHGCEQALVSTSQGGSVVFSLPPGYTVLPGTGNITVDLAWSDPTITGVMLRYRSPDRGDFAEAGVVSSDDRLTIPVTREMSDQGHERASRWDFALCAWSNGQAPVDVAEGSVQVTMVAYRVQGPLPLDPGHPDLWSGQAELPFGTASWEGEALAAAWRGQGEWTQASLEGIVPWDTRAMRTTCEASLSGLPEDPVLEAWYQSPASPGGWDFRTVQLNGTEAGDLVATLPVSAEQTDGVYGSSTQWELWFRLRGQTSREMPTSMGAWTTPELVQGSLDCRIDLLNDRVEQATT